MTIEVKPLPVEIKLLTADAKPTTEVKLLRADP